MELKFDPTVASEVKAVQAMLAGLTAANTVTVEVKNAGASVSGEIVNIPLTPAQIAQLGQVPGCIGDAARLAAAVSLSQQQIDAMDETAGLAPASAVPPVPAAPSTAVAAPSPTAPAVPQAGVPTPPSASAPPVPAAPTAPVPPAPAATTSPAPAVELDASGLPWDERIHAGSKARNADKTWRQRRNLPEGLRESVEAELRADMAAGGTVPSDYAAAPAASATGEPVATVTTQAMSTTSPESGVASVLAPPVTNTVPPVPLVPPVPPVALSATNTVNAVVPASDPVPAAPAVSAVPLPPAATAAAPAQSSAATPTATPHPAGSATASGQPPATNFIELCTKVSKLTSTGELSDADLAAVYQRAGVASLMALPALPDQGAAKAVEIDGYIEELFA